MEIPLSSLVPFIPKSNPSQIVELVDNSTREPFSNDYISYQQLSIAKWQSSDNSLFYDLVYLNNIEKSDILELLEKKENIDTILAFNTHNPPIDFLLSAKWEICFGISLSQTNFSLVRVVRGKSQNKFSIKNAYQWGRAALKPISDDESLESRQILSSLMNQPLDQFIDTQKQLSLEQETQFFTTVQKRQEREPLAYLLGTKAFMGLDFCVTPAVLIPRPETEILVEYILNHFSETPIRGLELGVGSGCITCSILSYSKNSTFVAVDISSDALKIAMQNVKKHSLEARCILKKSDLWQEIQRHEMFDCIVSNPPYISEKEYQDLMPEVKKEPQMALIAGDGLDCYRKILQQAASHLKTGGIVALEIGYQQKDALLELIPPELTLLDALQDYAKKDRCIILQKT